MPTGLAGRLRDRPAQKGQATVACTGHCPLKVDHRVVYQVKGNMLHKICGQANDTQLR